MGSHASETGFLVLSIAGFILLWPMMILNGTLVGLLTAAWTGAFMDGRALLTKYTHIWPIDFAISVLVAFFDGQINGQDQGSWLLMMDIVATLQAASLWVLLEDPYPGRKSSALRRFAMWPVLWNMFGAAFILSLYFYLFTKSAIQSTAYASEPKYPTRAISATVVLVVFLPAICMLLSFSFSSIAISQRVVAAFQFSPLFIAGVASIISALIPPSSKPRYLNKDRRTARWCYVFGALVSGVTHMYTLYTTLVSDNAATKFNRVFIPHPTQVVPGSASNVHDGALLFLQYDWIVINLSCALWAYLLTSLLYTLSKIRDRLIMVLVILVLTVVAGPSATVCSILWLRDDKSMQAFVKIRIKNT